MMLITAALFSVIALLTFVNAHHEGNVVHKPYVVSLENFRGLQVGGGVLVAEDVVLTSAHNVNGVSQNLYVRVGSPVAGIGGHLIPVAKNCPASGYNFDTRTNDVAILRLKTRVVLDKSSVAKLPTEGTTFLNVGVLSGWGYNVQGGFDSVQVKHVEKSACKHIYGENGLPESALCVNYLDNTHSCLDATIGNPLTVDDTVFGVVSAAGACDLKGYPAFVSEIPAHKITSDINACI